MERIVNFLLVPQNRTETALYMIDGAGLLLTIFYIADVKEILSISILVMTAISLALTLSVKIYNLFTKNDKNKKL